MRQVQLFFTTAIFGGLGAAVGSILGHSMGKAGLYTGAVLGGIVFIALAVRLAIWRSWIPRSQLTPTLIGGEVGFLVAAPLAVQMLSSPVGPIMSTILIGAGALVGSRREITRQ